MGNLKYWLKKRRSAKRKTQIKKFKKISARKTSALPHIPKRTIKLTALLKRCPEIQGLCCRRRKVNHFRIN